MARTRPIKALRNRKPTSTGAPSRKTASGGPNQSTKTTSRKPTMQAALTPRETRGIEFTTRQTRPPSDTTRPTTPYDGGTKIKGTTLKSSEPSPEAPTASPQFDAEAYNQQLADFVGQFGEFAEGTEGALQAWMQETGKVFDITQQSAATELQEAMEQGQDTTPIIEKYLIPQEEYAAGYATEQASLPDQPQPEVAGMPAKEPEMKGIRIPEVGVPQTPAVRQEIDKKSTSAYPKGQDRAFSQDFTTGYAAGTIEDPNQRNVSAIENFGSQGMSSILDFMGGMDTEEMTSGDILKAGLLMILQRGQLEDQYMENYFANLIDNANSAYYSSVEMAKTEKEELDKIIEGKEMAPTTYTGLQAKILRQQQNLGIESIDAEREYSKKQQEVWMQEETTKRARLEGYMKAKLVAMGAQSSTAGLQLLSMTTNQADLRIQMAQTEYNHGLAKLNLQSRQIMQNYYNGIEKIVMDTKAAENNAAAKRDEEYQKIQNDRFLDKRERQKLQAQAFTDFFNESAALKEKQQQRELELTKFEYQKNQDAISNALQLSGVMGNYYYYDPQKQEVVDSGLPTLDRRQWEGSNMLQWAQYEHNQKYDSYDMAVKLVDHGVENSSIEQILGMPSGSLAGLKSASDVKGVIGAYMGSEELGNTLNEDWDLVNADLGASGMDAETPISNVYEDGYFEQGLECGTFMHRYFDIPPMGDLLGEKIRSMDNFLFGNPVGSVVKGLALLPNVGDMIIQNVGTKYGHVAVVNSVNPDGTITLTESNYNKKWTVSNNRKIARADSSIVGIHKGDLKDPIQNRLNTFQSRFQFSSDQMLNSYLNAIAQGVVPMKNETTVNKFLEEMRALGPEGFDIGMTVLQMNRQMQTGAEIALSPEKEVQARNLSIKLYGKRAGTKPENLRSVKTLMAQGYSQDNIEDMLNYAGQSELLSGTFRDAGESVAMQLTGNQGQVFLDSLDRRLEEGDMQNVQDLLRTGVQKVLGGEEGKTLREKERTIEFLDEIKDDLRTLEATGTDTGILTGTYNEFLKKIGRTPSKRVAKIATRIRLAIINYRKAVSGAAFTESEMKEYLDLFPSVGRVGDFNLANIEALQQTFAGDIENTYEMVMGERAYKDIFGDTDPVTYVLGDEAIVPDDIAGGFDRNAAANDYFQSIENVDPELGELIKLYNQ